MKGLVSIARAGMVAGLLVVGAVSTMGCDPAPAPAPDPAPAQSAEPGDAAAFEAGDLVVLPVGTRVAANRGGETFAWPHDAVVEIQAVEIDTAQLGAPSSKADGSPSDLRLRVYAPVASLVAMPSEDWVRAPSEDRVQAPSSDPAGTAYERCIEHQIPVDTPLRTSASVVPIATTTRAIPQPLPTSIDEREICSSVEGFELCTTRASLERKPGCELLDGYDAQVPEAPSHATISATISVELRDLEVEGSLARQAVRRRLREHIDELRWCRAQAMRWVPDVSGALQLDLMIDVDGSVHSTSSHPADGRSDIDDDRLLWLCVGKSARRWRFPAASSWTYVEATFELRASL